MPPQPAHTPPAEDAAAIWAQGRALAHQLEPQLLRGRSRSQAVLDGARQRRRAGPGAEFWQFRPLTSGEPAQLIDWRRSARSDALQRREQEKMSPARVSFWCDASASMDYASTAGLPRKRAAALLLTAALMHAVHALGERVALLGAVRRGRPERLFQELAHGMDGDPHPLRAGAGGSVVLAGDWLDGPPILSGAGVLVQLYDPREAAFDFTGAVELIDPEAAGAPQQLDAPEALHEAYRAAWQRHCDALAAACQRAGWLHLPHQTDAPVLPALAAALDYLVAQ